MKHGLEIIQLLKEQGIQIDIQVENTINLIAYEIFNKGKEEGVVEGKKIGVNKACRELENSINILKSKNIIE